MHQPQKQKRSNKITIACLIVAVLSLAYAYGQHQAASMAEYALTNNCKWQATGTLYGDNRDYICQER